MKNTLRVFSFVLLLCMIVSLAACGEPSENKTTGSANTGAPSTSTVEATTEVVKEKLDEYIIGQDEAKRVLSVAVYNHYKRINAVSDKNSVPHNPHKSDYSGPEPRS